MSWESLSALKGYDIMIQGCNIAGQIKLFWLEGNDIMESSIKALIHLCYK